MEGQIGAAGEAAGDVLTGGIVAATVENEARTAGAAGSEATQGTCLNCGATLIGNYCSSCGQPARLHRSLRSLWHEILHSVFHFEGKFWRTLPELFLRPGQLTRRYIDGERVKFVSPMALFLFTVFVMFTVFSFTGGALLDEDSAKVAREGVLANWQEGNQEAMEEIDRDMARLNEKLADPELSPERRVALEEELERLRDARSVMEALSRGDFARIAEVGRKTSGEAASAAAEAGSSANPAAREQDSESSTTKSEVQKLLEDRFRDFGTNADLLAYKLKVNAYKFSWALIPLSVPFMWLLFFWRRDIRLYDHAVFVTYSISFMMLLVVLCSLASAIGVKEVWWGSALVFVPPWHMYRQLRGAFGLSRFGALVRLFFLLIATTIVLSLFFVLLVLIGALG
ncbi:MAG TPA: DUF3667 domain-containing protein [Steroidobacter sp.]